MAHRFVARSSLGDFRGCGARVRGSSGGGSGGAGAFSSGRAHVLHSDGGRSCGAAPAPDAPWHRRPGKRARSLDAFPTIAENDALRRRSLLVSKSITSFARYLERRPVGVVPAGDGSLDVDQLWVCWGRRCGFSRTQLLQHIADHAISDNGRRRFLLRSDQDGRTWVTVAAPLRRTPRRHRRGSRRRSSPQRGSTVDKPVVCPSHIAVSSEDDFVDDADIPGLHEEDPAGASADPDSPSEEAVPGDLERDVKLEHEVKSEEALVDDCSLAPTLQDVGSQTCKDEPQDSTEDAMPSAQVFTQSVPSLSPVSTMDSRSLTPPPGQTLYSVTPTVPCMRESGLSVDSLTREPWTSLGVTSRDSFFPGFLNLHSRGPGFPPSPYSVSPTLPDVPSIHIHKAAPSANVVPVPPSPPSPPTSSIAVSPSRHEVDDIASPFPGLGVTSLPGLMFWFVSLSMSLSSPPGLSLFMSLTPSLLFPRPRLVPIPAPRCVPQAGIPSPPCTLLPLFRRLPLRLIRRLGAVWAKPPATRTHYPRQAPRDSLPSDTSFLLLPTPQCSPLSLSTGPRPLRPTLLPSSRHLPPC